MNTSPLAHALASGHWATEADRRFETPLSLASLEKFEQDMLRPSFADHGIDAARVERVRSRYLPQQRPGGAHFTRPMHLRLLRKTC